MSSSICIAAQRPNPAVIAAQNDTFRRFACLGETPTELIQGRMVVTQSLLSRKTIRRTGMISDR